MTQAKHTPGPWEISESSHVEGAGEYKRIQQPNFGGDIVGLVCISHKLNSDLNASGYANAALIAAAPELLESLQKMLTVTIVRVDDLTVEQVEVWTKARAAIAKAGGAV